MAIPAAAIAKAAIGVLSNEKTRKAAGWVLVAILSPIILLIAAFCSILGGSADHNSSILDLCFYGGTLPADIPAEYRAYIEDMQASFALLDERIAEINSMTEDGESLDAIRVKALVHYPQQAEYDVRIDRYCGSMSDHFLFQRPYTDAKHDTEWI